MWPEEAAFQPPPPPALQMLTKAIEAKPTEESSNNGGVKKEESSPSAHGTVATVVILVLLTLTAAGIAGYVFYKRRLRQQVMVADFDNSVYRDDMGWAAGRVAQGRRIRGSAGDVLGGGGHALAEGSISVAPSPPLLPCRRVGDLAPGSYFSACW
ncbi:UNVERIFIED_CONTAM: hypothetical protein K2H54_029119 [Gekko kuhli]